MATSAPRHPKLPVPSDPDALWIVDLSGYIFRAYHAVAPLSSPTGEPTHAVHGTFAMLQRLIDEFAPANFVVCMDSKAPSFRKELLATYRRIDHRRRPTSRRRLRDVSKSAGPMAGASSRTKASRPTT